MHVVTLRTTFPPAQKVVGPPAVIVAVGNEVLTITVIELEVALHPLFPTQA